MAFVISSPEIPSISGCRRIAASSRPLSNPHSNNGVCFKKPRSGSDFGVTLKVRAGGVRDCDMNLHAQFSAPVKQESSPKQRGDDEEKRKYHLNTGYAIRILREDYPALFSRELNFDIYRDDIVLRDPFYTFAGIENYKTIFRALRFHGKIFFKALWVDIVSVWQPRKNGILIRWAVHGIPRIPWESRGRFDGVSEYKLDKNGKIYEHRVHNIAFNSPRKFEVLSVHELIQSIGCPSTAKPTFFEILSLPKLWIEDHVASAAQLDHSCEVDL